MPNIGLNGRRPHLGWIAGSGLMRSLGLLLILASGANARSSYVPEPPPALTSIGHTIAYVERSADRLFKYDVKTGTLTIVAFPKNPESFGFTSLTFWNGDYYAGSYRGLFRLTDGNWQPLTFLKNISVHGLSDGGDLLWVATPKDVYGIDAQGIRRTYSAKQGLASDSAYSVFFASRSLLVGTYRGLQNRYRDWTGTGLNIIDLDSGSVRRIKLPNSRAIVYRMFPGATPSRLQVVLWDYWSVEGVYEFDPATRKFGPRQHRDYYHYQGLLADSKGILARKDYWRFIQAVKATPGVDLYEHGVGAYVPGDRTEYYQLAFAEDKETFEKEFRAAPLWAQGLVTSVLSGRDDKFSLRLLLEASERRDSRNGAVLSILAGRKEPEAVRSAIHGIKDPTQPFKDRMFAARALVTANGQSVVGVLEEVLANEPNAPDWFKKDLEESIRNEH